MKRGKNKIKTLPLLTEELASPETSRREARCMAGCRSFLIQCLRKRRRRGPIVLLDLVQESRPTPDGGEAGGARADGGAGPRAGGAAASSWACAASSSPSSSAPAGPWRHGGGPRGARRRRPSRGEQGPASALRASGHASGGEQAAGGAWQALRLGPLPLPLSLPLCLVAGRGACWKRRRRCGDGATTWRLELSTNTKGASTPFVDDMR